MGVYRRSPSCAAGRLAVAALCADAKRYEAQGKELEGEAEGILGMKQAWPSTIRTVKGDHKRFEETYFSAFPVRLCCSRHPSV